MCAVARSQYSPGNVVEASNSLGFVEEVNREGTNITLTHKQTSKDAIKQRIHANTKMCKIIPTVPITIKNKKLSILCTLYWRISTYLVHKMYKIYFKQFTL